MKKIGLLLVLFSTTIAFSQQKTFEKEVSKIAKRIEIITQIQKDSLKIKVLEINQQLKKGQIKQALAAKEKKNAATYHADQIALKVSEQESLLQILVQDKTNGKIASSNDVLGEDINATSIGNNTFRFTINAKTKKDKQHKSKKRNRKTTSQFVFAMGVNNVLENNQLNSLSDSNYKFWQSHFYEVGFTCKTRLSKEASQLYFKYGLSFLWNNLRLEDNKYHVKNGNSTEVQTFAENLSDSRLRHVQMNFPVHLEWDLSKNKANDDGTISDRRNRYFRFGIGGFVGFKLGTRQYLEYSDSQGLDIEELQKDNFNMNTFNYGLSTYMGYKSTSFYVKYDLNALFKHTETRNVSMGIRLDLD